MPSLKLLTVITTSLLLSACATPQAYWQKTGVSPDDTHTALAECRYQVKLNKIESAEREQVISDCMESKGFRWSRR